VYSRSRVVQLLILESAAAERVTCPRWPQASLSRSNYVLVCAGLPNVGSRSFDLHERILAALVSFSSVGRVAVLVQVSCLP